MIQEGNQGGRREHEYEVPVRGRQGSTLSSATFRLAVRSNITELMTESNKDKPTAEVNSHTDSTTNTWQNDGIEVWRRQLRHKEIGPENGLEIDEANSHDSRCVEDELVPRDSEAQEKSRFLGDVADGKELDDS